MAHLPEESSLDRYLRKHGWRLTNSLYTYSKQSTFLISIYVAVLATAAAVGVATSRTFNMAEILVFGALLLVPLPIFFYANRRSSRMLKNQLKPKLSHDAKLLFQRLVDTTMYAELNPKSWGWMGIKTRAYQELTPTSFELMDRAATECNRVFAVLDHPSPNETITRLSNDLRQALDDGMVSIIEQVTALEHYPESLSPVPIIERRIKELNELATRVESLNVSEAKTRIPVESDALRRALEELRFDALARQELSEDLNQGQGASE